MLVIVQFLKAWLFLGGILDYYLFCVTAKLYFFPHLLAHQQWTTTKTKDITLSKIHVYVNYVKHWFPKFSTDLKRSSKLFKELFIKVEMKWFRKPQSAVSRLSSWVFQFAHESEMSICWLIFPIWSMEVLTVCNCMHNCVHFWETWPKVQEECASQNRFAKSGGQRRLASKQRNDE